MKGVGKASKLKKVKPASMAGMVIKVKKVNAGIKVNLMITHMALIKLRYGTMNPTHGGARCMLTTVGIQVVMRI